MRLIKAFNFAAKKHQGQERRGTKLPYVIHPVIVSHLISKYKAQSKHLEDLQIAALLHDTIEDTDTTYQEIEREFGPLVASLVMELTSDPVMVKELGKNKYLMQKMTKMSKYAFVLKLIDRLSNIYDQPGESYARKTIQLMDHLRANREELTERQILIMDEIDDACDSFLGVKDECELDLL